MIRPPAAAGHFFSHESTPLRRAGRGVHDRRVRRVAGHRRALHDRRTHQHQLAGNYCDVITARLARDHAKSAMPCAPSMTARRITVLAPRSALARPTRSLSPRADPQRWAPCRSRSRSAPSRSRPWWRMVRTMRCRSAWRRGSMSAPKSLRPSSSARAHRLITSTFRRDVTEIRARAAK